MAMLVDADALIPLDDYIAKLSTGRVLGMVDQWWDFAYTVNDVFKQQGLDLIGCNYVPLGLTTSEGMKTDGIHTAIQLIRLLIVASIPTSYSGAAQAEMAKMLTNLKNSLQSS